MKLFKTSILTSAFTFVRLITGFIINKFLAVYVGPSGIALVAQLQNFNSIAYSLAKAGISSGIVKYIADPNANNKYVISNSLVITTVFSTLISILIFVFSEHISDAVLNNISYTYVFKTLSATIILISMNSVLLSIFNGLGEIKKYTLINIISSIISVIFTVSSIKLYGLNGALFAIVVNQAIVFFITLLFFVHSKLLDIRNLLRNLEFSYCKKLFAYSSMTIVTSLLTPLSTIYVRNKIIDNTNDFDAGLWQSMIYLSTTYTLFFTTTLSVYYVPKISSLNNILEIRKELKKGLIFIFFSILTVSTLVYIFKFQIISIVFTENFLQMSSLFKFYLIGDVLKVTSFVLSNIMLAKALTKLYISTELIFSISFICLNTYFINIHGFIGTSYAYSINCLIYLIFMLYFFLFKYERS